MALQVREKGRVYTCVVQSCSHTIGYGMTIGAHNTVYVQIHLAGSTMFAWYGKRRRLQYCLRSDASGRLYSARLTWPGGTVLQVRRAWLGTVLGITVDLSALPYLLCLLPGPTPSWHPWSVIPSRPRPSRSGKSSEHRSGVSSVEERGSESDCGPTTARPSGRTSDQLSRPEVLVRDRIVVLTCHCVSGLAQARVVAAPPLGNRVHWGPRVYEPDT